MDYPYNSHLEMLNSEKVGRPRGGKITQYHIDPLEPCCFCQRSSITGPNGCFRFFYIYITNDIMGNIFIHESLFPPLNISSH